MKCFKCKSRQGLVRVPSLEKKACNQCFKRIIEKRFGKAVKGLTEVKIKLERPSDKVLKHLFEKRGIKVLVSKKPGVNQSTLDDICISILKSFFSGKDVAIKKPSPLEGISEAELADYARIEGLKFKSNPRKGRDKELYNFLMELDKRRPGVMYSIRDFMKKLF